MYQKSRTQSAFTLIELMLAMTFISILMLSIAMLTLYLGSLYNRGSTLKDVSQAGTEIASDIKRSINAGAYNNIKITTYKVGNQDDATNHEHNDITVMCTGGVIYVANGATPFTSLTYSSGQVVGLAKLVSTDSSYCPQPPTYPTSTGPAMTTLKNAVKNSNAEIRELLSKDTLAIYSLTFDKLTGNGQDGLIKVKLKLGTSDPSEIQYNAGINDDQCRPPAATGSNGEWCAINTFEIISRTGSA